MMYYIFEKISEVEAKKHISAVIYPFLYIFHEEIGFNKVI